MSKMNYLKIKSEKVEIELLFLFSRNFFNQWINDVSVRSRLVHRDNIREKEINQQSMSMSIVYTDSIVKSGDQSNDENWMQLV